eukprot:474223-Rhodomonas_salina.1
MAHGALPLSPPPSSLEQRVLHSVVVTKVIFSPVYACCVFVCVGEEDDEGHGDEDDSEGESKERKAFRPAVLAVSGLLLAVVTLAALSSGSQRSATRARFELEEEQVARGGMPDPTQHVAPPGCGERDGNCGDGVGLSLERSQRSAARRGVRSAGLDEAQVGDKRGNRGCHPRCKPAVPGVCERVWVRERDRQEDRE